MSHILFAWELGDHHGHLWRLLPIALALRERGHAVSFALRPMAAAQRYLAPRGLPFVPCPSAQGTAELGRDPSTYTDILALNGAADADVLGGMLRGWRQLFKLMQPDLIVTDHAPTALMASRVEQRCSVQVGTGFAIPPTLSPSPCFRPWDTEIEQQAQCQARVEQTVQTVCEMPLADALRADHTRLLSLPELDHYARLRPPGAMFLGGMPQPASGEIVAWQTREQHLFVYLQVGDYLPTVLDGLATSEAEVIAVIPGIAPEMAAEYPGLRIYTRPVQLGPLLVDCDLVISHASHGTALNCLRAGVPMLMLPQHMEQLLLTERVALAGAGLGVYPTHIDSSFEQVLYTLLSADHYRDAARVVAQRYAGWRDEFALQQMLALLGSALNPAA